MHRPRRLRLDRLDHPAAALFALAFCAYAYFYQAGGWNQNVRFDLVRSLVERGTASIDGYHHNTGDLARTTSGEHYCDKAPGVSWLGALPYAAVYALAGGADSGPEYLAWASYAVTVVAIGMPAALAVVALWYLLVALGLARGPAAAVAAAYALGTLAWPYATLFYGHQLAAALLLIGFAVLVVGRRRAGTDRPLRRPALGAAGLVLGYAVAVEYPAALAAGPILLYGAWWLAASDRRGVLWLAGGALVPVLALAGYHWLVFGGPATLPYEFSTQGHRGQGFMGIGAPQPGAVYGVLLSPYRGLFFSSPWLLAAVPGAVVMMRRPGLRAEALVCVVAASLFGWLNVSLVDWQGGWAMGPRYLVPAVPFLAVLAGGVVLAQRAGSRGLRCAAAALFGALTLGSGVFMLAGTAVKPEVDVRIERPFSGYLLPRLVSGELSVSTQSIDMKGHPGRGVRHAWNLGQRLGLGGHASLVPLFCLLAVTGWWLRCALRASATGLTSSADGPDADGPG
jgi:hypothetical protein